MLLCCAVSALSSPTRAEETPPAETGTPPAERPDPLARVGGRIGGPIGDDPQYDPVGSDPRYDAITRGRITLPQAEVGRAETVQGRPRPEFDPQGQYIGSFLLYPRLGIAESLTDNVFLEEHDQRSDLVTNIQPGLSLKSDWGRHALGLDVRADVARYAFNSDESYEDYSAGLGGLIDVIEGTYLAARIETEHLHESRDSPDDVGGQTPTVYDLHSAGLLAYYPRGRFNFTLSGLAERFDYDDVGAGPCAAEIDNDDRDRNVYQSALRFGYEIQPQYEAYVRTDFNLRSYDQQIDNEGFERDSYGFATAVGVAVDFSGLVFGDFFIGYRRQEYVDEALEPIQGVNAGADLTWNVTPLTTVNLGLATAVEDTTVAGASGFQSYRAALTLDHELLRSLILTARAGASLADYEGIDRSYYDLGAGMSAKYYLNRYLYSQAGYRYRTRLSDTVADEAFEENLGYVSIGIQY